MHTQFSKRMTFTMQFHIFIFIIFFRIFVLVYFTINIIFTVSSYHGFLRSSSSEDHDCIIKVYESGREDLKPRKKKGMGIVLQSIKIERDNWKIQICWLPNVRNVFKQFKPIVCT